MAKKDKDNKPTAKTLNPLLRCDDYPAIMQCSTACQNCRYNIFAGPVSQQCRPHTPEEAQRKGAPREAPPEHLHDWLSEVKKHEIEKELQSQQNQESCSN